MEFVAEPKHIKDIALLKYAGADVMVVFPEFFSAGNFDRIKVEELAVYKEECERLRVRLFVDMTRMFVDQEMDQASAFLDKLQELNIDGIYFADLCVFELASEKGMQHLCIYQPDTLITCSQEAALYLGFGMQAVCAARELTLAEYLEIAKDNPQQMEVFVHGIPLMSFSKRHLLSNYFDEISYQGERKSFYYLKEEKREERMPVVEDEQGTRFYGGYCQQSYAEIMQLQQAGVKYARIQSQFLDTIAVVRALQGYRDVLRHNMPAQTALQQTEEAYPDMRFTSGFYYTKTSAKREDL